MFKLMSTLFGRSILDAGAEDDPREDAHGNSGSVAALEVDDPGVDLENASSSLFAETELSEAAHTDPVISSLHPNLKMRRQSRPAAEYTLFDTLATKAGLTAIAPDTMKRWIAKSQEDYAEFLSNNAMFVSMENQFEGYRRLIILQPNVLNTSHSQVIAIDSEGRLSASKIRKMDPDAKREVSSVAEVLELLRHGVEGYELQPYAPKFDLNRRARTSTSLLMEQVSWLRPPSLDSAESKAMKDFNVRREFGSKSLAMTGQTRGILMGKSARRHNLLRWALTSSMDPEVLRMMRGTNNTALNVAIRLSGTEGLNVNEAATEESDRLARNRQQAVRSYPILSVKTLTNPRYMRAVDEMLPLAPVIADDYSISESDVRRLQGLTWQKAAVSPRNVDPRIRQIASIPENFLPKRRPEFRNLDMIQTFGQRLFGTDLPETLKRLGGGGDPMRFIGDIQSHPVEDINDSVRYLAQKLHLPATIHKVMLFAKDRGLSIATADWRQIERNLVNSIIKDAKPKDLFAISERYHRNIQRYEDRIEKLEDHNKWHGLVGDLDMGDGIRAVEITSSERMSLQGRTENHCVGGYTSTVLSAERDRARFIFSIERAGKILSTTELRMAVRQKSVEAKDPGDGKGSEIIEYLEVAITQNRAAGNAPPSPLAQSAAEALCKRLEKLEVADLDNYVHGVREVNRIQEEVMKLPSWIRSAGYSPFRKDHLQDAWDELSVMLPRPVRKAGLDAFIEGMNADGIQLKMTIGRNPINDWDVDHLEEIRRRKEALQKDTGLDVEDVFAEATIPEEPCEFDCH